ncbi:TetR family transcriptional regulator [Sphingobium lactosutens]|uniref:TetR/AcrR family transcriptional regulator n=1 Tax=Sphingobium lactosutens TaxID=522773 RepID=UPI0015BB08AC|nr:TetR/AcrR family transcriptional regulator [Sphingobium lactosutens]NWK98629.1 TetR family transcriptional regulator [Sphingobium lactosutens]
MVAVQHEKDGRSRILTTARDLFATKGFHQTSMAQLASAAQVSVGQIYRLFKGKEDIIEALVQSDSNAWNADMVVLRTKLEAGALSLEQTFEQLLLHGTESEKDEAFSFDILAESFRNEAVGETIATLCAGFRAILRDFACIANPDLSGEALDAAEELILACMFGFGHRSVSRPKLSAQRAARRGAQMIVAGLKAVH